MKHIFRTPYPSLPSLLMLAVCLLSARTAQAQPDSSRSSIGTAPVMRMPRQVPTAVYSVSIPKVAEQKFQVTATFTGLVVDTLQFPIWAPGAYDVVDYGKYVQNISAVAADGSPVSVTRIDSNRFVLTGTPASDQVPVTISYTVRDIESVPNSMWMGLSDIEPDYAFANATALFGYIAGHKDALCTVTYNVPNGWDIAVGLDPGPGLNTFRARDYDELVDAPVQMGKFQRFEKMINGKMHVITMTSPTPLDSAEGAQLVAATDTVVKIYTAFFGDVPYNRYVFQHFLADFRNKKISGSFGALEHRNSSTYVMPYSPADNIRQLTPVIAHEYFHLWSPKRIHVRQLGPFDYQTPPRTSSLWFAEGITEYYARVLLARNGMRSKNGMLGEMNSEIEEFDGKRQAESLTELSLKIAGVSSIMEIIPLYTKGPLIGLLLDAEIRSQTGNTKSLDDAMRFFNNNYGKTGQSFGDEDIIPIMEQATGARLGDFYNRYIAGHEPLPFEANLPKIGLRMAPKTIQRKTLGAEVEKMDSGGIRIISVTPRGSAALMKMRAGDVLTSLIIPKSDDDGSGTVDVPLQQLPVAQLDELFSFADVSGFVVLRDGRELRLKGNIVKGPVTLHNLTLDPKATPLALAARKQIMGF